MKKMLVLFCCLFLCGSCASFGKTTKPAQEPLLHEYAEQVLDDFQHFGLNRNLYGKEISYLGQTETVEGYHQIYIHSTPKMTLNEQRDNMMSIEAYTCELIALRVNETEKFGLEGSSSCMEQWSYQLTGVNIQSIYFDQSNVYVSTGKGPVWKFYEGDYNVFCFDKENGKQILKQVVPGPVVTSFYTWNDSLMFSVYEYSGSQMVEIDSRDGSILGTYNNVMEGVQVDDAVYFTSVNIEEEPILEKYSLKTKTSEIVWNGENSSSPRKSYNSFVTSPVHVQDWLCYATFLNVTEKPSQCFLYDTDYLNERRKRND
ncbi:MAG: hypothetical protein KAH01_04505 [Caldisericia bacterium]|nr:hypothetical protein [Caldisericia bacterium]